MPKPPSESIRIPNMQPPSAHALLPLVKARESGVNFSSLLSFALRINLPWSLWIQSSQHTGTCSHDLQHFCTGPSHPLFSPGLRQNLLVNLHTFGRSHAPLPPNPSYPQWLRDPFRAKVRSRHSSRPNRPLASSAPHQGLALFYFPLLLK